MISEHFYAKAILDLKDKYWIKFAGYVYLIGVEKDYSFDEINRYVFECFHTTDKMPLKRKSIEVDMELYICDIRG